MQSSAERKEAIRKFKERKPRRGTYAVRCKATGRTWVGSSRNLDATRNGCWFCLRNGSHPDRMLQQEWSAQGEEAFEYEILETLDDDIAPIGVADLLNERKAYWLAQIGAQPL